MQAIAATSRRVSIPRAVDSDVHEDALLVAAIDAGDQAALADAYQAHSGAVYAAAYAVLRRKGPSEDVTQEIFVRLWNQAGRFDARRGSLRSFLRVDARGRAIDLVRSESARRAREDREARLQPSEPSDGTEEAVMKTMMSDAVQRILERLKAEERDPIALAYFGGHSYRKVAEMLNLPEGTVKSRIRNGLANLKQHMETAGIEAL